MENYNRLSQDIRNLFINYSAQNPGFHLSSSLGLVETSIALLNVINNEDVKILFDIGHQRYPFLVVEHYLQTGELKIPDKEVRHDIFLHPTFAGLSTALAAGVSISTSNKVFALIGDGAFTSGEIYEGLNLLSELDADVTIIHNQNDMSIRENVGVFKNSNILKSFASCFGFNFTEVSDGHNIKELTSAFRMALGNKNKEFINIRTIKGKGYLPSENNPLEFHQPFMRFDVQSGEFYKPKGMISQFFECYISFEKFLDNLLEKDNDAYLVFPSTPPFQNLIKKYSERVIDTGITEQLSFTLSTSIALSSKKVFLPIFCTFISRCFSQFIDLCLSGANVKIVGFFNGLTPFGMVQQSMHVRNIVKSIPNCKILQPVSTEEFEQMLEYSVKIDGPVIIFAPSVGLNCDGLNSSPIVTNKGFTLKSGDKMTVLPIGSAAFQWVNNILTDLLEIEIINPRFLKPFDIDLLALSVKKTRKLLVLEDGYKSSGFGGELIQSVREVCDDFESEWVGYDDKFLCGQSYSEALIYLGCSDEKIRNIALSLYNA